MDAHESKKEFVEKYLKPCLVNSSLPIVDCYYERNTDSGMWADEFCVCVFESGDKQYANITGDSTKAIITDVARQILERY